MPFSGSIFAQARRTCSFALLVLASLSMQAVGLASTPRAASPAEQRVTAKHAVESVRAKWRGTAAPSRSDIEGIVDREARAEGLLRARGGAVDASAVAREWNRMKRGSRDPGRWRVLLAVLQGDEALAADVLARPAVVERRLRVEFARDPERSREPKERLEALRALILAGDLDVLADHPRRLLVTYTRDASACSSASPLASSEVRHLLDERSWIERDALLGLHPGTPSPVQVSSTAAYFEVGLTRDECDLVVARYAEALPSFGVWEAGAASRVSATPLERLQGLEEALASNASASLGTDDTCEEAWEPGRLGDLPDPREGATAVWTGAEMILWGGRAGTSYGSGSRYDPATDTWSRISPVGAPSPRSWHTAVWTGTRMLVWGGIDGDPTNTGAAYDPSSDSWTPLPTTGAPSPRHRHTAVWTGSAMLIWGGEDDSFEDVQTGASYDPSSGSWTEIAVNGAPSARKDHTAIFTGTEMIVWGGFRLGTHLADGGALDPISGTWRPLSGNAAPEGRRNHTATWTGAEMVVFGGTNGGIYLATGGRYDPASDSWAPTASDGAPSGRRFHVSLWTGSSVLVWGGEVPGPESYSGTGSRYDPATNTWAAMTNVGAPVGRAQHSGVWTGSEFLTWGGESASGFEDTGGRYDPLLDVWSPLSNDTLASRRYRHTVLWTGAEFIVFGGIDATDLGDGSRYDPVLDTWTALPANLAPSNRRDHTAVWTGSLMLVWGGRSGTTRLGDGAAYDPGADSWSAISSVGSPGPRYGHTAVWTGTEMIVFGGVESSIPGNTGGRYDPATDTWTPTTITGAPSIRTFHTAVWTGTEMIVWGGEGGNFSYTNSGRRYSPLSDSWTAMPTTGAPAPRSHHTAIWSGTEMIVWGGFGQGQFGDGARFDPDAGVWSTVSISNAPSPRYFHRTAWTGTEMIVWGGLGSGSLATGSRYSPAIDVWSPMALEGAPAARHLHGLAWADARLIVWGGLGSSTLRSGSRYSPGASQDGDGDGIPGCADCDDQDESVYPGAEQICDGVNNDCDDPLWPAIPAAEIDDDGDGLAECAGDCDDLSEGTFPGAPQLCDGINNDCQDSSWPAIPADERDEDEDGYAGCGGECDDGNEFVYPGAPQICDGVNNDCSDAVWPMVPADESDDDGDGTSECQGDCDDTLASVFPGAPEICDNQRDDDCDDLVDTADPECATTCPDADVDGFQNSACNPDPQNGGGDCNDTLASVYPGAPQLCDGINNDCDDAQWPTVPADETDDDGDGTSECQGDCNDTNPQVNPGVPEECSNGIDDDCDDLIDAADPECGTGCPDTDGDGYQAAACNPNPAAGGGDCDDDERSVYPEAAEVCDGLNNDCLDPAWPALPPSEGDADGDGIRQCADNCPGVSNPTQENRDYDSSGDVCDSCPDDPFDDLDGDGLCAPLDRCPFVPSPLNRDLDGDGIGDVCDTCPSASNAGEPDVDGDGRQGACDSDEDGDGLGNTVDADADNDGIANDGDGSGRVGDRPCASGQTANCDDNCPLAPNPDQWDLDADGRGDSCDGADDMVGYLDVIPPDSTLAETRMVWDPERVAAGYRVYRSTLTSGVTLQDAGTCYRDGLLARYTGVPESPPAGQAFGYIVAMERANGLDGPLGRSSGGAGRVPGEACP